MPSFEIILNMKGMKASGISSYKFLVSSDKKERNLNDRLVK